MVALPDVEEREHAAIYPPSSLLHQILVGFHGVGLSDSIWSVFQVIFLSGLAVYAETQDTILSEVHVGLFVILLLDVRIQQHFEVAMLEQVRLVSVGFH